MLPITESETDRIDLTKAVDELIESVDNFSRRCEQHVEFCSKLDEELLQLERYLTKQIELHDLSRNRL